jgi:uncharacterized protein YceH (UPF0502 family)
MIDVAINTVETDPDTGDLLVNVTMPVAALPIDDGTGRLRPRNAEEAARIEAHVIRIPEDALDDRVRFYGLARRDDAVFAIVREHAKRLNALPDNSEVGDLRIDRAGGLRSDVTVARASALVSQEAMAMIFPAEPETVEAAAAEAVPVTDAEARIAELEAELAAARAEIASIRGIQQETAPALAE